MHKLQVLSHLHKNVTRGWILSKLYFDNEINNYV